MGAYLLRRLGWGVATVLGVLLFLFVLFFVSARPTDVARRALGEKASPEVIAQWLANHGYDKPAVWNPAHPLDTMLADHYRRMLGFDFGTSDADDVPIAKRLRQGESARAIARTFNVHHATVSRLRPFASSQL